jgi:hypothetical protein
MIAQGGAAANTNGELLDRFRELRDFGGAVDKSPIAEPLQWVRRRFTAIVTVRPGPVRV